MSHWIKIHVHDSIASFHYFIKSNPNAIIIIALIPSLTLDEFLVAIISSGFFCKMYGMLQLF